MINNSTDGLVVQNCDPETFVGAANNDFGRKNIGNNDVKIEICYINNLSCQAIVVDRNGFRHRVKPNINGEVGKFIVRTIYTLFQAVYEDCKKLLAGSLGVVSKEVVIIAEATKGHSSINPYRTLVVCVDHYVTLSDLTKGNGSVYLKEVDTVISTLPFEDAHAHPFAINSVSHIAFNKAFGKDTTGPMLGIGIELVNRQVGAREMYSMFLRGVKAIPVSTDTARKEGFYITSLQRDPRTISDHNLVTEYFPLEAAEELGIYSSSSLAMANGDFKLLREEEISRLKHEAEVIRTNAQIEKQKSDVILLETTRGYEKEMQNIKREDELKAREHDLAIRELKEDSILAARDHENIVRGFTIANQERERAHADRMQQLERERESVKDAYEGKNYKRKDFSETLKIISATITTMGVLILAYNKAFPKEK